MSLQWPNWTEKEWRIKIAEAEGEDLAKALHYRTTFGPLQISIENRKGSIRTWTDHSGKSGETKLTLPYGYIRMSRATDGDHCDVFLGPNEQATHAYIVHTTKAPDFTDYDEDKVFLGLDSAAEAKQAFFDNYSDPRFFGSMHTMPMAEFIERVLATKDDPQMIKAASTADNAAYVKETALIRANKQQPDNQQPHPFEQAEWTWPNAHPRCLRCGEEESTDGMCSGADLAKAHGQGLPWRLVKAHVRQHTRIESSGKVTIVRDYERTDPAPTFYSQAERVLSRKMPSRASAAQIAGILSPENGVKPDELT